MKKINRRWFIAKSGLAVPFLAAAPALGSPDWVKMAATIGSTPPDSSNLIEWLKADAITGVTNGNPISTWQHSAGSDATASGTARPTYITAGQNGLPVARFDGSANVMTTSSIGTAITIITMALAFKYQGSTVLTTDIASIGTSDLIGTSTGSFTHLGSPVFGSANNNFNILVAVYNVAATTITWAFNGNKLTTTSGATSGPWTGALNLSKSGSFSQVDIGEILIYSVDESSNYSSIYNYLYNRWS